MNTESSNTERRSRTWTLPALELTLWTLLFALLLFASAGCSVVDRVTACVEGVCVVFDVPKDLNDDGKVGVFEDKPGLPWGDVGVEDIED